MGLVGEDEQWEKFRPLHDYLAQAFPLTYVDNPPQPPPTNRTNVACPLFRHQTLTLTKVNTYGLLYEWKGSDDSLKPLLLAAHQGSSRITSISPTGNTTDTSLILRRRSC